MSIVVLLQRLHQPHLVLGENQGELGVVAVYMRGN